MVKANHALSNSALETYLTYFLGSPGKKSHIVTFHPLPQIKLSYLDHEIFTGIYLNRVTVRV